jgi:hypothetical protein
MKFSADLTLTYAYSDDVVAYNENGAVCSRRTVDFYEVSMLVRGVALPAEVLSVDDIQDKYGLSNEEFDACIVEEDEREYGWFDEEDFPDTDHDDGLTYSQRCWSDRADYANERLMRGEICAEQAAEIRMGA